MQYKWSFLLVMVSTLTFFSCQKDDLKSNDTSLSYKVNISKEDETLVMRKLDEMTLETVSMSAQEKALMDELNIMADDLDILYLNVDEAPTYEAKYIQLKANIRSRLASVVEKANVCYNGNIERVTLAKNNFVLMTYDAITQQYPNFMWTSLGCFAANEVRNGIVLSYLLRDIVKKNNININIENLSGLNVSNTLMDATQILMEGQLNVLTDIGALALLNKYGPQHMTNVEWLTQEARNGFSLQLDAETALNNGEKRKYEDLQTLAAVEFGAHEQIYILQPLWDKDLMVQLAAINEWMLKSSKGKFSVFGDIFIGTNKYTEFMMGRVFKIPQGAFDLTKAVDRVSIARNGFLSLNNLRHQPMGQEWITRSQNKLGNAQGVYRVPGF